MAEDTGTGIGRSSKASAVMTYFSRMMLAMKAGLMFQGARDLYQVYGYDRQLTQQKLYERYLRQDVARRIVNLPAEAIWTAPPEIVGSAQLVTAWKALMSDGRIWNEILRADYQLGFSEYSAIFLGLPGAAHTPAMSKGNTLAYVYACDADRAQIKTVYNDPTNRLFGRPQFYNIDLSEDVVKVGSVQAHSSRIIHITNNDAVGKLKSVPRLVHTVNLLDDLLKICGGSAETYWLTSNRGMQADIDKDMELSEPDAAALSDELDEFQHQLRRIVRTRGVKITNLGSEVADPTGSFSVILALLSAATSIPQRILVGAEAGQLASEQDRANWAYEVDRRRKFFAEPNVLRPLVSRLMDLGLLPTEEGFSFKWPEAFLMSPLERAQTMAQKARAAVNLSRQAQLGAAITSAEEAREICELPRELPQGDTPVLPPEPKKPAGK